MNRLVSSPPLNLLVFVAAAAVSVAEASAQPTSITRPTAVQTLDQRLIRQRSQALQVSATAADLRDIRAALSTRAVTAADSSQVQAVRLNENPTRFSALVSSWRVAANTVVPVAVADAPRRVAGEGAAPGADVRDTLAIAQLPGEIYQWPVEWVRSDRNGRTRHVALRFTATPLGYDRDARRFVGRIDFWAVDPNEPGSRFELAVPIALQAIPEAGEVTPGDTLITRAHIPTTTLFVRNANPVDSLPVRVLATDAGDPHVIVLPVRPSLRVTVGDTTIQGWGVETAEILVELVGTSAPIEAVVSFSGAAVEPSQVTVAPNAPARAHLRSSGTGPASLTAHSDAFGEQRVGIAFVFPFLFFGLAIGGSALGASLGLLTREREPTGEPSGRPWIAGVIAGLVLGAAYFGLGVNLIGIDLPAIPRFNEIAVAVVAALAAAGWVYKDSLARLVGRE